MNDKELDNMLHAMKIAEIEKMLRTLAIRLSYKTAIVKLHEKVDTWRIAKSDIKSNYVINDEYIRFKLMTFFGVAIAYDVQSDILVYWYLDRCQDYLENSLFRHNGEAHNLLRELGEGFNRDTRWEILKPRKSTHEIVVPLDDPTPANRPDLLTEVVHAKHISVPMVDFFGRQVGYNKEFNILILEE